MILKGKVAVHTRLRLQEVMQTQVGLSRTTQTSLTRLIQKMNLSIRRWKLAVAVIPIGNQEMAVTATAAAIVVMMMIS